MLHFSTNNGIYVISFAQFKYFLYMHAHISDTDESKEKLALFDLQLALIEEKLHQTNSTGIGLFIQLFNEFIMYIHVHVHHD